MELTINNILEKYTKEYRKRLSYMTYDYNMDYDIDIKPIAKNKEHFEKWLDAYPFYANVKKEEVGLYRLE